MIKKINLGVVNYLNTKPLLYGIQQQQTLAEQTNLVLDYPANISKYLLNNTIDVGLVPVAIIPKLNFSKTISNYCIGAVQAVASVCLFSKLPIQQVEKIYLDTESQSSVALTKLLCKKFYKIQVQFENRIIIDADQLENNAAVLLIGDKALVQQEAKQFNYIYDLAQDWITLTQLPFVFAAWVANKPLPNDYEQVFNQAMQLGINSIDEVVKQSASLSQYNLKHYFTKNISYTFDEDKQKGLELFLQMIKEENL